MLTRRKILLAIPALLGLVVLVLMLLRGKSGDSAIPAISDASVALGFADRPERPRLAPVSGTGAHSLSGRLRGANGEPVAGASITAIAEIDSEQRVFGDAGPGLAIVANTDLDGSFTLQGTGVGSYRLRIEGEMLVSAEVRFVDSPGSDLELLVARSIRVSGRVHEGNANRAEVQVFLQAETSPELLETRSGPNGEFSFAAAEGAFRIWAQAPAHAARVQRIEALGAGPFEEISLALEAAYTLHGRVVEAGGSELGVSASVILRSDTGAEAEHRVRALEDGSFAIPGVLGGRWIAEASAPGFVATMAPALDAETAPSLRIALHSGGRIAGQVVGPDGQGLVGATLRLVGKRLDGSEIEYSPRAALPASGLAGQRFLPMGELGVLLGPIPLVPPRSSTITRVATAVADTDPSQVALAPWPDPNRFVSDYEGSFAISGVEPGDYRLLASHEDFPESSSAAIAIRGTGELQKIRLRMLAGSRLSGVIRDQAGLAIAGASVFVRFDDGREESLTVSDQDGHYAFSPLRGMATIVAEAVGHERGVLRRKLSAKGNHSSETEIDMRLARADSYIESRVVDSTGFAVRGASLRVEASERLLPTAARTSDDDGIFRLEGLPAGAHWVSVHHADYPDARVKLSTGQSADIVLALGGGLSVSLRDGQSQASIAMATLKLVGLAKGGAAVQAIGDERGQALVLAMQPGRYAVEVEAPGYGAHREEVSISAAARVGEASKVLVIELFHGAVIAGILRDKGGDRVDAAILRVGSVTSQTDTEGRFRLENVPSGEVSVQIEKGSAIQILRFEVQAGEERTTMELVFAPELGEESSAQAEDDDDDDDDDDDEKDGLEPDADDN